MARRHPDLLRHNRADLMQQRRGFTGIAGHALEDTEHPLEDDGDLYGT